MLTIIMHVVRISGTQQFLAALNVVGWGGGRGKSRGLPA